MDPRVLSKSSQHMANPRDEQEIAIKSINSMIGAFSRRHVVFFVTNQKKLSS